MSNNYNRSPKAPLTTYQKTEILTANRETILLMLYSGAIRFLRQAMDADEKGNVEVKAKFIGKTQDVITELRSTLNFEIGGEIALRLESLYLFVMERLSTAVNPGKSTNLKEALEVLMSLNEAWQTAVETFRKERAKEEP